MLSRCTNENNTTYDDYGGRGITVCERWQNDHGFENFLQDMGPRPANLTLERRDNSKGYTPDNCYWATRKQQARNRRTNIHVTYEGRDYILIELAEKHQFPYKLLHQRIARGWSIARALNTPIDAGLAQSKHWFEHDGKSHTLLEWSKLLNIPYQTLYTRIIRRGLPFAEAIT